MNKAFIVLITFLTFQTCANDSELFLSVIDEQRLLVTLLNDSEDPYEEMAISHKTLCSSAIGQLNFYLHSKDKVYIPDNGHINYICDLKGSTSLPIYMGISKVFDYSLLLQKFRVNSEIEQGVAIDGTYKFKAVVCNAELQCFNSNLLDVVIKNGTLSFL